MNQLLTANLLSPITLCFVLGVFSKVIKSDFNIPKDIFIAISTYLLFSIGLNGGVELSHVTFEAILKPGIATLLLGVITPISAYCILRKIFKFSISDSAGIAAHYGSVSAVTFIAAQNFVGDWIKRDPTVTFTEGYMSTLLTLLESPGIHVALAIGALKTASKNKKTASVLHEVLTGKTMVLLVGGLFVGFFMDKSAWGTISQFFDGKGFIFRGCLSLFLLEMGTMAGARLSDLKKGGIKILLFGTLIPILHGMLGVLLGSWAGLSVGGCTILATMAASASYIAAPPAVRLTLPEANPSFYLTSALAVTFPFNIIIGIPLYAQMAYFFINPQ